MFSLPLYLIFAYLTAFYLFSAFQKFSGQKKQLFVHWGYALTFMYLVAIAELLSAIGIWVSDSRQYAILAFLAISIWEITIRLFNRPIIRELIFPILNFLVAGGLAMWYFL